MTPDERIPPRGGSGTAPPQNARWSPELRAAAILADTHLLHLVAAAIHRAIAAERESMREEQAALTQARITAAVAAERERCAQVAERYITETARIEWRLCADSIAEAIRSGE